MCEFYLLEDCCLKSFVSHVSLTGFGCLVSFSSDKLQSILLSYDMAVLFRDYLLAHVDDCYGYNIVPFKD